MRPESSKLSELCSELMQLYPAFNGKVNTIHDTTPFGSLNGSLSELSQRSRYDEIQEISST